MKSKRPTMDEKRDRVNHCNELIKEISVCGRKLFCAKTLAYLKVNQQGQVFFVDDWTGYPVFTHYEGKWRHFSHGGTLRRLIIAMREYVCGDREHLGGHLGPWPRELCNGDLWGYGGDMQKVRDKAFELGLLRR